MAVNLKEAPAGTLVTNIDRFYVYEDYDLTIHGRYLLEFDSILLYLKYEYDEYHNEYIISFLHKEKVIFTLAPSFSIIAGDNILMHLK